MPAEISVSRLRLIGITDRHVTGMGSLESAAAAALEGGLPALMLREKDLPDDQVMPLAQRLRRLTAEAGALLIVNRRPSVARAVGADAVHLGADGPSLEAVRDECGGEMAIGYSAHDVEEAVRAGECGADYILFSPIYETPSKRGVLEAVGLEPLRELARKSSKPAIALGGIGLENVSEVMRTGAAGVAVIRAIFAARSPAQAARDLLEMIDRKNDPVT